MGPIGRCLSAFCIADNKAVVFPPDSRKQSRKDQLLVQAVAAISQAAAQSLEAALAQSLEARRSVITDLLDDIA